MTEEKTQETLQQMQMIEQSIQQFSLQRQQFQSQLLEINSALEELDKSEESYKIIGNIMVNTDKTKLKEDLARKKEVVELRIKTLESQETKMKEKSQAMQQDVMKDMKK
tara:strand:- start:100 stop:426 length:327 start_codon:yes stop_codon:yes gene_type:complete